MTRTLLAGTAAALFLLLLAGTASAEYLGATDLDLVYQNIADSRKKVEIASDVDSVGSGTPYFAATGAVGSTLLAAGVFGSVVAMLFLKSRNGRYAAQGRG